MKTPWINIEGFKEINTNQQHVYSKKMNEGNFSTLAYSNEAEVAVRDLESTLTEDLQQSNESNQFDIDKLVSVLKKVQTIRIVDFFDNLSETDTIQPPLTINENSKVDESITLDEEIDMHQDLQDDSNTQTEHESLIDLDNVTSVREQINENESTEPFNSIPLSDEVHCRTIKSLFSTYAEIDNFLHLPIFGDSVQNTFTFLDPLNKLSPQLDTKLISTIISYCDQPFCQLISSEIHESLYLTDAPLIIDEKKNENKISESVLMPVHSSPTKGGEMQKHLPGELMAIKVPVIAGEYRIEICLEEEVIFNEEVKRIKEITKKIVLTKCDFIPTQLTKAVDVGTCKALKGMISIEGYLVQNIEYVATGNNNANFKESRARSLLQQKISLGLLFRLLQEQKIQLNVYDI